MPRCVDDVSTRSPMSKLKFDEYKCLQVERLRFTEVIELLTSDYD